MSEDAFSTLAVGFTLAQYQLTIEALEPLHLSPFKGSALRGGFGHTFKRLACSQPWPCGDRCQLGNACAYGYIFETAPPDDSEVLRTFGDVPRPFVIEPPDDRRTLIPAGERLIFGLTLVGRGIKYLPHFVAVFCELGRVGLGRTRGKYRLLAADALSPYNGATVAVYRAEDERVMSANSTINGEAIAAHAATMPADRLALEFLTPARLKHEGRWVQQGPPFDALVKTLLGRVSSLSYFHCGQRLEADFRGLIDRAAGVRIARSESQWEDWSRFSGRQQQRVEMGGLVGRVTYEGDLGDYLPLLALGELVHVGKGTVFGNGQYRIVGASSNENSDR
jgi:hypothetical protein